MPVLYDKLPSIIRQFVLTLSQRAFVVSTSEDLVEVAVVLLT